MMIGDHVVIRDWSGEATLGGGIVLEAEASRRGLRNEDQVRFLHQRAAAPDDLTAQAAYEARVAGDDATARDWFHLGYLRYRTRSHDESEHPARDAFERACAMAPGRAAYMPYLATVAGRTGSARSVRHPPWPSSAAPAAGVCTCQRVTEVPLARGALSVCPLGGPQIGTYCTYVCTQNPKTLRAPGPKVTSVTLWFSTTVLSHYPTAFLHVGHFWKTKRHRPSRLGALPPFLK